MAVDNLDHAVSSLFLSCGSPVISTVLDLLPGAIAFWSRDRLSCILNSQARQLLGFSEIDFRKDPSIWINRIDPRDRALFSAACKKLQGGEKMVSCDYRFSPNGSEKEVWLRDVSVSDQNTLGEVGGFISAYTNISDLKARRLKSHRNGKDEDLPGVIDGLVHEIQNNLQIITSGLELWRMSGGTPSEYRPLGLVTGRVNRWIQELREYFLPPKAHYSKADPAGVLVDVIRHMENELQRQGIRLKLHSWDALPPVRIDLNQFRSALERLMEFSCALLPQGGELEIDAGLEKVGDQEYVRLKVVSSSSNSVGVEENEVYRPFLRINNHQLGLSIPLAFRILRRHHGKVFFQRESPKKSQFTILLRACAD